LFTGQLYINIFSRFRLCKRGCTLRRRLRFFSGHFTFRRPRSQKRFFKFRSRTSFACRSFFLVSSLHSFFMRSRFKPPRRDCHILHHLFYLFRRNTDRFRRGKTPLHHCPLKIFQQALFFRRAETYDLQKSFIKGCYFSNIFRSIYNKIRASYTDNSGLRLYFEFGLGKISQFFHPETCFPYCHIYQ